MDEYVTVAVHKEFADKIEREDDRQNKRIGLLEESMKQIYTLNISVEKIAMSIETLTTEIGEQNKRLKAIEDKPAQNWDKLLWAIGGAFITAIIAMVIKQVGL
jgi:hypothetical protein